MDNLTPSLTEPPKKKPKTTKASVLQKAAPKKATDPKVSAPKQSKLAFKSAACNADFSENKTPVNDAPENDAPKKAARKKATPRKRKFVSNSAAPKEDTSKTRSPINDAPEETVTETARSKEPATNPIWPKPSYRWSKKAAEEAESSSTPAGFGDVVDIDKFGGFFKTHTGQSTMLKALLDKSQNGVMIFVFRAAATAGCSAQAMNFRDNYEYLTSTGLSIYGVSVDSPRHNANFKEIFNLPFDLLCDKEANLIRAMGFKRPWGPMTIRRGLFVLDKRGKVLLQKPGGPDLTLEFAQRMITEITTAAETALGTDAGMTTSA
ncbi:Alkyl hydroperoxide reductase subunit C/ Thiol specific antioxidant [Penicillium taxi]|uniref:Alkyl hydroperoxide reductase subunit C/ Thiol specific antioxidant n=1 Tax=Penicillium taxi TaxID=168475 RepID=UPI0025457843|nr:Alkyl hydroperoxide reductase subunit C/ Thiol specific antioxidant [Penicillium taxi]KAJ5907972.1 Alkyl hydroperoxide reductase subunit C/ Thiol specific antioxidant [Penicillium taxi]